MTKPKNPHKVTECFFPSSMNQSKRIRYETSPPKRFSKSAAIFLLLFGGKEMFKLERCKEIHPSFRMGESGAKMAGNQGPTKIRFTTDIFLPTKREREREREKRTLRSEQISEFCGTVVRFGSSNFQRLRRKVFSIEHLAR